MNVPNPNGMTPEQAEQSVLVQNELLEVFERMTAEGIDYRVMLAGIGSATARLIGVHAGGDFIARWFAGMAEMVTQVGAPDYRGKSH